MTENKKLSVARLMACQALCMYYDENNSNKNIDDILESINEYFIKKEFVDKDNNNDYDQIFKDEFVHNLINGVINNSKEFDELINKFLQKQNTTETIEDILLQSFRLAIYELKYTNTDKNLIVNEYVDIVSEFYDGVYISFSNGIIDNIALNIREGKLPPEIEKKENKNISNVIVVNKKHKREIIKLNSKILNNKNE